MLNPIGDLVPPTASPTASSISSSDLDTESTGSFFHDRSTTLGTLMGVRHPPTIPFRPPSDPPSSGATARLSRKQRKHNPPLHVAAKRRRRWWRLCGDDDDDANEGRHTRPACLGEFLDLERRYGDCAFINNAVEELEGGVVVVGESSHGRVLFADGRVLPPASNNAHDNDDDDDDDVDEGSRFGSLCGISAPFTGICSGG